MKRGPLVLVGMAVAIFGYALIATGVWTLNPAASPTGASVGLVDSLIPGKVSSTKPKGQP